MALDKETVRRGSRLEAVIPALLGTPLHINGSREPAVRCPFHEDQSPSLRINLDRQVWHCDPCGFGGDVFELVERVKGVDFPAAMRWLAEQGQMSEPERRIVATYDYTDEGGALVYQVVRLDPKGFRQRRPDGNGGWIWNMAGVPRVLYCRPKLTGREAVVVAAGEKDVNALWAIGIPATTNSGGETKWTSEHTGQLVSAGVKRVLVIPDNDETGRQHACTVAASCVAAGLSVKMLTLPGVPVKGDVSDYLASHSPAELMGLMKSAPPYESAPDTSPSTALESSSDVPHWPEAAPAMYHGLLGRFVSLLTPDTEADPVGLLAQGLVAFGNVIGRSPHFVVEDDRHALNLFVGVVGATSKGRKGTGFGRIRARFEAVDGTWAQERITGNMASGEGLVHQVRDPRMRTSRSSRRQDDPTVEAEVEDPGVADKRLLVYETELASALRVMERDGNTLSAIIRQAWDTGTIRNLTKTQPSQATGAHISIVGHITKEELRRYLTRTEVGNGFGNRFLWICVRRQRVLPWGGSLQPEDLARFDAEFDAAVQFGQRAHTITMDAAARGVWERVYADLSEGKPGMLGAIISRAEAQVRRLACLYALLDCSVVVTEAHLIAALALWEYAEASARFIFGEALGDPVADDILRALNAAGATGLTRTEINGLFAGNKQSAQIQRALTSLAELGLAGRPAIEPGGSGRPAERWIVLRPQSNRPTSKAAA